MQEITIHSQRYGTMLLLVDDIDAEYAESFRWRVRETKNGVLTPFVPVQRV